MPDLIDAAQDREQNDREIAIKYTRKPELQFIGSCYNCSEPITRGVYCSVECREDDEKRRNFNKGKENE